MTKKLISLLLVGLMVLALAPMGAFARAESRKVIDTASKFVPNKAGSVATREEIINDGALLNEGFEASSFATGWWTFDKDGDTHIWEPSNYASYVYEGDYCAISRSYYSGTVYNADDWLMTPEIAIPSTGATLSFYAKSQDPSWPDALAVLIAKKGAGAYNSAHTTVVESKWDTLMASTSLEGGEYQQYNFDLINYAGSTVTVAFRHQDSDKFVLCLDKVQIGTPTQATPETSITLDPTTATLEVGETVQLTCTVGPDEATFKDYTYTISDPTIVGINELGWIMGLAEGTATVTATSHNGLTATCTVTVSGGDPFDDEMVAYGCMDTTWYNIDQYGYLTAIQADADSSFIVRSEYNPLDGLIYAYVSGDNGYEFCTFDPEHSYAKTVIGTVDDMPMWMAFGFDTGEMYGCWWSDDGTQYTGSAIAVIDLATGNAGETVVDTYTATWEEDGESGQYYCLPMFTTYVGGGYFVGYDYNYEGILAYSCAGDFEAFFIANDITAQLGEAPQMYVQKMWYNPIDGKLYWAGVFNNLDMVIIDLVNGALVMTGPTATDEAYDEITVLYTPYTLTVDDRLLGDVDCNGVVDMSDISMLFSFLNGGNVEITEEGMLNADANEDGTVNIMDISAIFTIIANS